MSNPTGYETIARFRGGEVLASDRRVVVIGMPDDASDANGDSLHNCDAMGCGQSHVVAIVDRPAPPTAKPPPAYCATHEHAKWCEHNGGVMGATGWEASRVDLDAPAEARAAVVLRAEVAAYSRLTTDVTLAINAALGNDARLGAEIHHEVTRIVGALRQELAACAEKLAEAKRLWRDGLRDDRISPALAAALEAL